MKLPTVLNIADSVVIFGGGQVAKRKVEYLSSFTKNIKVIAEKTVALPKYVDVVITKIKTQDIPNFIPKNTSLVIAALSDTTLNSAISKWCQQQNILVNVVDNEKLSTILFPALSHKGPLNIAISTSGKCPFLARKIREDIDQVIEEKATWLEVLSPIREKLVGIETKNTVLTAIYENPEIQSLMKEGKINQAKIKAREVYNVHRKH